VISHRETRTVPYSAELMYAVVSDVENYPRFLPWVVALRVLSRRETGMTAEMAVGYGALRERYTSEIRLDPAIRRIDVTQIHNGESGGPFKQLENHWQFTPAGEGCEISFSILFEFKSRLLHSVAGAKFEKVMLKMADAFVAQAKQIKTASSSEASGR
jgi:coenzyme Q-binding protein COQ10